MTDKQREILFKIFREIRLEVISRSGINHSRYCIGISSPFDIIWESTCDIYLPEIFNINDQKDFIKLQEFKENFINTFIILHHKYFVEHLTKINKHGTRYIF